jgi:hypothetical protein
MNMKRLSTIACFLIILSGCAHIGTLSPPADGCVYVWADENDADTELQLSVSMPPVGEFNQATVYFKEYQASIVFDDIVYLQGPGGSSICADGRAGWCNSSVYGYAITPTGVTFRVSCNYSDNGHLGEAKESIFIPYTLSGHGREGAVSFKYKWKKK